MAASLTGWQMAGSHPDSYTMEVDTQVKHSGSASARLSSKEKRVNGFGTMMQQFTPVEYEDQRVRLSGWTKTQDVEDWAGLWMRVDGTQPGEVLAFDNMGERPLKGTQDWTQVEIVLDVPEEATNLAFGVLLSGTGTVWLDGLEFEVVPKTTPVTASVTQPTNLGFDD